MCYTPALLNSVKEWSESIITLRKDSTKATKALAESGQRLYEERLRDILEPEHTGRFVAIEPETGRYFLGDTGIAALRVGRGELPDKLFYLMRVGYDAAYRVGGYGAPRG